MYRDGFFYFFHFSLLFVTILIGLFWLLHTYVLYSLFCSRDDSGDAPRLLLLLLQERIPE